MGRIKWSLVTDYRNSNRGKGNFRTNDSKPSKLKNLGGKMEPLKQMGKTGTNSDRRGSCLRKGMILHVLSYR